MRRRAGIPLMACAIVMMGAGTGWSGAVPAAAPSEVTAGVRDAYQAMTDLSADFTQSTTVPGFATTLQSKGKVYLAKGKMRWDYTEPSNQQIFVNDRRIQYYIPAHKQVIVSTLTPEADDQIPLHFLMTLARLDEQFTVGWEDPAVPQREGAYRLRLEPKSPTADLDYVTVAVDAQRRLVTAVALHPRNGNASSFVFTRLAVNPKLESSLFSFSVPPGVEVVETPTLR